MDVRTIGPDLETDERLDALVGPLRQTVAGLPSEAQRALRGEWLGHPLHPMLTDLPIGFWTSAFVLDLLPTRRVRPATTVLVGLGVVTALPAVAAGLADWSQMARGKQRVGVVHAASNLAATTLYGLSFKARLRGRWVRGAALAMAGATAATAGGYLGGHLAFGGSSPAAPMREAPPSVVDVRSPTGAADHPVPADPTG